MKKIIHLSDLHIGYGDLGERFQCVSTNMIFEKEPAKDYVVVITGDIVERARDDYYDEAKMYMERLDEAGFTVLVVPGNHDYGTGAWGSKKFVGRFKKTFFGKTDVTYPKLDIIQGTAFIGLDSMAEELHIYDALWANGELGDAQFKRLDRMLSRKTVKDCKYRVVYLHHHPFDPLSTWHQLKDSADLKKVLSKHGNINALLYGHNHLGKKHNGKWGISRCYDAGSSTRKNDAVGDHRVIDLSQDARWDYDADFHCNY